MKKNKRLLVFAFLIVSALSIFVVFKLNTVAPCPSDLNNDGKQIISDKDVLMKAMGSECECQDCDCPTDLNKDGKTTGADLMILIGSIGMDC